MEAPIQPLDFVVTPKGSFGIVSEIIVCESAAGGPLWNAAVEFIGGNENHERKAWWLPKELKVIDSLPKVLANMTCHPMGNGKKIVKALYSERFGDE